MLSSSVYRDLTLIVRHINLIQNRLVHDAEPSEIDLLVEAARDRVRRLAETIDARDSDPVIRLLRHLRWVSYWHRRESPERYASDIEDINERDLPGLIDEVAMWEKGLLSPGLVDAVYRSWEDRNYVNAVRDSFIYLEQALRGAGAIPATDTATASALVNRLLNPSSPERLSLPGEARSGGELEGIAQLFQGAFLVFRNPVAHRFIDHDAQTADEILRLVDLCLRILGTEQAPSLEVHLLEDADLERALRVLEDMAANHPGGGIVRVLVDEEPSEAPHILRTRVDITDLLIREMMDLADVREASLEV